MACFFFHCRRRDARIGFGLYFVYHHYLYIFLASISLLLQNICEPMHFVLWTSSFPTRLTRFPKILGQQKRMNDNIFWNYHTIPLNIACSLYGLVANFNFEQVLINDLKELSDNCRSSSGIEHASRIMEEEKIPEKLSKGVSTMSLTGREKKVFAGLSKHSCPQRRTQQLRKQSYIHQIAVIKCLFMENFAWLNCNTGGVLLLQEEKFLQDILDVYESAVGDVKGNPN